MRQRLLIATSGMSTITALAGAQADTRISHLWERFGGPVLNEDVWSIMHEPSTVFSLDLGGKQLRVSHVSGPTNPAYIAFNADLETPINGDFSLDLGFDYETAGPHTQQDAYFILYGPDDQVISQFTYRDRWPNQSGGMSCQAGDDFQVLFPEGNVANKAVVSLQVDRVGDTVTLFMNGDQCAEGQSTVPVKRLTMLIGKTFGQQGDFGSITVHDVALTSPADNSSSGCAADLAPPFGALDFSDVITFLTAFAAGCP